MKSKLHFAVLVILSLLTFNQESYCQPKPNTNVKNIINGRLWVPTANATNKKQFLLEKRNLEGSLLYNGVRFNNINFTYDLSEDIVITGVNTDDYDNKVIIVNPYLLEGFSVDNSPYKLEFLRGGLIHNGLDSLGYYQTIKSNSLVFIIKRKTNKIFTPNLSEQFKYIHYNSLYLIKESELISIRDKKDILNLFPNQKKEMKRFIRDNKLKIKTRTPMDIVRLLNEFDL